MIEEGSAVDCLDYPFEPHWMEVEEGRIHYVDEGSGPPVVLVHGTPTWSYLYRRLIKALSSSYRVIAPDHLGFGRSDKPPDADYRPEAHARNLATLLERLDLVELVLGVHDFGGPIGLSYALERPDDVRGLVLFNTWMWSLEGTSAEFMSRLFGTGLGRFLYTRLNLSPRLLLKAAFGDPTVLTADLHAHYLEPFPSPEDRIAPWVLARELAGSSSWYDRLWARRETIARKASLVLWGMKDPAFGTRELERWRGLLTNARVVELAEVGHFVQEEAPARVEAELREFLEEL